MSASPEPSPEAGPSRQLAPPASAPPTKGNGRKRKAGGEGKKGKIFLEDKAGLMSLMANITGDKDSVVQTKLENQRRRNPDNASVTETSTNVDKAKLRQDRKKDRSKALRDAKLALAKEAKEKKREKKGKHAVAGGVEPDAEKPKKKRVGFA